MSATVTVSTSVILAPTQTTTGDYIVYFPNIGTNGRLITVRDNDGFASTNHAVILSTIGTAQFQTGVTTTQSQIYINQPFGFITLNSQSSGRYTILNTFAFPEGSAAAFVSKVTTNNLVTSTLQMIDIGTQSTNTFFTSTGFMYLNSSVMGQVSDAQLQSTVNSLGTVGYISTVIIPPLVPALYIATGFTSNQAQNSAKDPLGSIVYSQGNVADPWFNATAGYSFGFSNGGNDVVVGSPYIVAVGDSFSGSSNQSYIQTSVDGSNWNYAAAFLSSPQVRLRVSYANGLYHAVGSNSQIGGTPTIMWSHDGTVWNNSVFTSGQVDPFAGVGGYARGIAYGNGRWVTVGYQPAATTLSIINSTDGSNWNQANVTNLNNSIVWDVAFNGTRFLALAAQNTSTPGGNIVRSLDGVNWSNLATPYSTSNFFSDSVRGGYIAASPTICLLTASNNAPSGNMMWRSLDGGDTWSAVPFFTSGRLSRPFWDGANWWVGFSNAADPNAQSIHYSADGLNWFNNVGTNSFQGGFPQGFGARNAQSNFATILFSTVVGLSSNQNISSLQTNVISTNSITAATMTVSSLFVQVEVISTSIETINTVSTMISDYTSTIQLFANQTTTSSLFVTSRLGISTMTPLETVDINGVLNLRAGTVSQDSTTVDESNRMNTYIRFGEASTLTDYAYLRQIGGPNEIHLALDFHDDFNDGSFSIRNVESSGATPDKISTLFMVDGRNKRVGILTSTPQVTLDVNGEIRSKISTFGYVALTSGSNGDYRGVLEFRNGAGVRQGYIGWASDPTTYINMATENGAVGYSVSSNFRVGGSLGIGLGTGVPSYPLDVNGQVWARSTLLIGSSVNDNQMRFYGTTLDGAGSFNHTVISERIYESTESSELLIFKGNDIADRVRVLAGSFQVDVGGLTSWSQGSAPPTATYISSIYVSGANGNVGIKRGNPGVALDVTGEIRASDNITAFSDIRYKENIFRIENALSSVKEMRGVFYNPIGQSTSRVGVIAQEMENVLPEVVCTDSSEQANKSVAYGNITAVLIEAVKELSAKVDALSKR